MNETDLKMKSFTPKPLAELIPGLSGILSKETMLALTKMDSPKSTMTIKPMTLAEMRPHLLALTPGPGKPQFVNNAVKKPRWNSSVKVEKIVSHTANGHLKNHSVRKTLTFQPTSKVTTQAMLSETPKFPKIEVRAKKALNIDKNNVRISGVHKIPKTPAVKRNPLYQSRLTIANKENTLRQNNTVRKLSVTPKLKLPLQKMLLSEPDTSLSNMSWKSSADASFLRVEIDIDEKTKEAQENIISNVDEIDHQVSTPFKEYRNVQEFFTKNDDTEKSLHYDNTLLTCNENSKWEESVIVSLCNMLDKATVSKCEKGIMEYKDLVSHVEKQTKRNIEVTDNKIKALIEIKKSQQELLQIVGKLNNEI